MPHPGDQHRENHATTNPFLVQRPHVTEYTAQEIATLQSRLDKQLGPEYISTRPGNSGGKVHYLAAEKVINLANEVFGFNGWSSAIQNVQIDFVDESETGRINLGLSSIVRVTLRDGTFHEDVGYGHCENTKGKAAAFEKAKKESVTDGLKRALRNFGNVLGNCLYDKDYLQKVTKVKVAPSKWDAENLHRHPDYATVKKEANANEAPRQQNSLGNLRNASAKSAASNGSIEVEDDFGGNLFEDTDFVNPDEVRLDDSTVNDAPSVATRKPGPQVQTGSRQVASRTASMPQMRPPNAPPAPAVQNGPAAPRPPVNHRPQSIVGQSAARQMPPQTSANMRRLPPAKNDVSQLDGSRSNSSTIAPDSSLGHSQQAAASNTDNAAQDLPIPQEVPQGVPSGFVTGRKADLLNQGPDSRPPDAALAFNPHAESPSIRRTSGINPGKSAPVSRQHINGTSNYQQVPPVAPPGGMHSAAHNGLSAASRPPGPNFVNPASDINRKIGMPQNLGGRPGQNGAAYRPPTAVKRPAMTDVTNIQQLDGASDPKKAKLESAPQGGNVTTKDSGVAV